MASVDRRDRHGGLGRERAGLDRDPDRPRLPIGARAGSAPRAPHLAGHPQWPGRCPRVRRHRREDQRFLPRRLFILFDDPSQPIVSPQLPAEDPPPTVGARTPASERPAARPGSSVGMGASSGSPRRPTQGCSVIPRFGIAQCRSLGVGRHRPSRCSSPRAGGPLWVGSRGGTCRLALRWDADEAHGPGPARDEGYALDGGDADGAVAAPPGRVAQPHRRRHREPAPGCLSMPRRRLSRSVPDRSGSSTRALEPLARSIQPRATRSRRSSWAGYPPTRSSPTASSGSRCTDPERRGAGPGSFGDPIEDGRNRSGTKQRQGRGNRASNRRYPGVPSAPAFAIERGPPGMPSNDPPMTTVSAGTRVSSSATCAATPRSSSSAATRRQPSSWRPTASWSGRGSRRRREPRSGPRATACTSSSRPPVVRSRPVWGSSPGPPSASTRERPIAVGVGVHAGETVATTEGLVGGAVNIAARVCAKAQAGEVLVTDTVRALTRTYLPYRYTLWAPRALKASPGASRSTGSRRCPPPVGPGSVVSSGPAGAGSSPWPASLRSWPSGRSAPGPLNRPADSSPSGHDQGRRRPDRPGPELRGGGVPGGPAAGRRRGHQGRRLGRQRRRPYDLGYLTRLPARRTRPEPWAPRLRSLPDRGMSTCSPFSIKWRL